MLGISGSGFAGSGSAVRNGAGQLLGAGFAPQHGVGHSSGILYDRNGAALNFNRIAYRVVRDDLVRANRGPGFLHDLVNGQFGVGDQAQTQIVLGDLAQGSLGEGVGQAKVQGVPAFDVLLVGAGELAVLDHEVDSVLGVQTVVHTSALNSHGDVFCMNRVLLQEVVVHRHDAARLVLESRVGGQRDDRTQSAVLNHVVGPDIAEDGSVNFAVFHRSNGGRGFYVAQLDVVVRVNTVFVEQAGNDVVVGVADAVMDSDGLALQILNSLDVAVVEHEDSFAADMRTGNKGVVYVVGDRNQHGRDVVDAPHSLAGADRHVGRIALYNFGVDAVLLIVAQHVSHVFGGYAVASIVDVGQLGAKRRFLFHGFPVLCRNAFRTVRIVGSLSCFRGGGVLGFRFCLGWCGGVGFCGSLFTAAGCHRQHHCGCQQDTNQLS